MAGVHLLLALLPLRQSFGSRFLEKTIGCLVQSCKKTPLEVGLLILVLSLWYQMHFEKIGTKHSNIDQTVKRYQLPN